MRPAPPHGSARPPRPRDAIRFQHSAQSPSASPVDRVAAPAAGQCERRLPESDRRADRCPVHFEEMLERYGRIMTCKPVGIAVALGLLLSSCARKNDSAAEEKAALSTTAAPAPAPGPKVTVHLKSGKTVGGTIVASSAADITVDGEDGTETKIATAQIRSIDYGAAAAAPEPPARSGSERRERSKPAPPPAARSDSASNTPAVSAAPARAGEATPPPESNPAGNDPAPPPSFAAAPPPANQPAGNTFDAGPWSRTLELPVGSEVSVRLNETIDSKTAQPGQTFDAEVTRHARDIAGDVVIPRGARARIQIKSASKGDRFHGSADLVLDMKSVTIAGKRHRIGTADLSQKGKSGVGLNTRTAKYAGGAAAIGAIIGAIAGGGKGAAIGAGAGAGAGVLGEVATKGGSIKIPAETVLTFRLDQPLLVTVEE